MVEGCEVGIFVINNSIAMCKQCTASLCLNSSSSTLEKACLAWKGPYGWRIVLGFVSLRERNGAKVRYRISKRFEKGRVSDVRDAKDLSKRLPFIFLQIMWGRACLLFDLGEITELPWSEKYAFEPDVIILLPLPRFFRVAGTWASCCSLSLS